MMSLEYINQLAQEAAEEAAQAELTPYTPWSREEVEGWTRFPFPNLGDYRPDGWELTEELFCDSSGMGQVGEAALTISQLKEKVLEGYDDNLGYGITQVGEFQVYVGVFQQV